MAADQGDDYVTVDGQLAVIREARAARERIGRARVILDDSGLVIRRLMLHGIVRDFFRSCSLACWVGASDNGPGFARRR